MVAVLLQAVDVVEHDGPNPMGILGNLTFQKVHRRAAGASASSTPSRAASRSEISAYKSRQAEAGAAIPQRADFRFWPKGGDWASAGVEHGTVRSAPHPTCRDWTGPTTNKLKSQQPTDVHESEELRRWTCLIRRVLSGKARQGKAHSMGERWKVTVSGVPASQVSVAYMQAFTPETMHCRHSHSASLVLLLHTPVDPVSRPSAFLCQFGGIGSKIDSRQPPTDALTPYPLAPTDTGPSSLGTYLASSLKLALHPSSSPLLSSPLVTSSS
ncbi:hypothetical protein FALBO_16922 [Fusarium albosuccineum]|uniref:Uncharacterized protein n=1 Tax=Fusarium albosuccineum TaxID=1237068 RepID=A0A8H4KC09_9HYPO|nr:hypothetical protein FALBO_16922 [Fusarium albosuccineum]